MKIALLLNDPTIFLNIWRLKYVLHFLKFMGVVLLIISFQIVTC